MGARLNKFVNMFFFFLIKDSERTMSEDLHGSQSTLNRKGLFGKWRSRYGTKSSSRSSPKMSPIANPRKFSSSTVE